MSIKITTTRLPIFGDGVTVEQLKALVTNYYSRMRKRKGTLSRKLGTKEDAKSAWFPKEKIDELFKDNGCNPSNNDLFGLRIYYGVHKKGILRDANGDDIPEIYDNQQAVILVATMNVNGVPDDDQLGEKNFVQIAGYTGIALDNGKLCPPQICDGSQIKL